MNRSPRRGGDTGGRVRAKDEVERATDEGQGAGCGLRVGNIDFGIGRGLEAVVLDASAHSDDREPIAAVTDSFSERTFVKPEALREDFVHDRDRSEEHTSELQ